MWELLLDLTEAELQSPTRGELGKDLVKERSVLAIFIFSVGLDPEGSASKLLYRLPDDRSAAFSRLAFRISVWLRSYCSFLLWIFSRSFWFLASSFSSMETG